MWQRHILHKAFSKIYYCLYIYILILHTHTPHHVLCHTSHTDTTLYHTMYHHHIKPQLILYSMNTYAPQGITTSQHSQTTHNIPTVLSYKPTKPYHAKPQRNTLNRTYLRNWLFAVLGSPTTQTLMSPRRVVFSWVVFGTPPNNINNTPRFTSSFPWTQMFLLV